jgi:hypothetical protein
VSESTTPAVPFDPPVRHPIHLEVTDDLERNRLTVFFRLLLAIPALIVLYVLQLVAEVVSLLSWFYALVTGNMNRGMRDLLAYWLRYQAQTGGYILLLTSRYPSFSDD